MTYDRSKSGLDELQGVLEAYGADRDRWPQVARVRVEPMLASGAQATRLLAEAKALDAVLAHAPLPARERQMALAERIVAAAQGSGADAATARQPGTVIPWPGTVRRPQSSRGSHQPAWRAAALLAASLVVGTFIGALDLAPSSISQLVEAVDLDPDFDQLAATMASDGLATVLDEDLL